MNRPICTFRERSEAEPVFLHRAGIWPHQAVLTMILKKKPDFLVCENQSFMPPFE